MTRTVSLIIGAVLAPLAAFADDGTVILREASGPFRITVFAAPATPRAGPVEFSALVQDRDTGALILGTTTDLELQPIDTRSRSPIHGTLRQAKNKLLQGVTLGVPARGWWAVKVCVRRDRDAVVVAAKILIVPAAPRVAGIWPYLILPPFAIGLFALHQVLGRSKRLRGVGRPRL